MVPTWQNVWISVLGLVLVQRGGGVVRFGPGLQPHQHLQVPAETSYVITKDILQLKLMKPGSLGESLPNVHR